MAASSSNGATPCSCSLCAAAQEACGGALGPAGRFFGGGLCGQASCCEDRAPAGSPGYSPLQVTAGMAAPGVAEASRGSAPDGVAALGAAGGATAGAGASSAVAAPWWRQGRCQLQFAVLLLLSIANISVSVAACLSRNFQHQHQQA